MRLSLIFSLVGLTCAAPALTFGQRSVNLTGQWRGALRIPTGATLQLRLAVQDANGHPAATLDIPTQHAQDIAVERMAVRQDSAWISMPAIKASFAGRLASDGQQWRGIWQQNGARLPLLLQRTTTVTNPTSTNPSLATAASSNTKAGRPQEPVAPFPYRADEVQFTNKSAGLRLAGTLTLPAGKGPFPAVVLLTGSGPQDRDETVFGHRPFLVIADYLTRQGIAVLRFDDRGVGKSQGSLAATTAADYAQDALAALAYLRGRSDIDGKQVGLIGHSEGGTAGIRAAGQPQGPAFLVLLGTAGIPGSEVVVQQALANARAKTTSPQILAGVEQRQRALIAIAQRVADASAAQAQMVSVLMPNISLPPEQTAQLKAAAVGQASLMTTPAFRFLLSDNPQQTLRTVRCPVLALGGAKDVQVNSAVSLPAIEKALKSSGNRDVTVHELPGLNHMFQTAPTGALDEYGRLTETFSPVALRALSDWLTNHTD